MVQQFTPSPPSKKWHARLHIVSTKSCCFCFLLSAQRQISSFFQRYCDVCDFPHTLTRSKVLYVNAAQYFGGLTTCNSKKGRFVFFPFRQLQPRQVPFQALQLDTHVRIPLGPVGQTLSFLARQTTQTCPFKSRSSDTFLPGPTAQTRATPCFFNCNLRSCKFEALCEQAWQM